MANTIDPREEAKRRAAEREAEMLGAAPRSMLPHDPTLPPDAQAIRAAGMTPLERINAHGAGLNVYDGDMSRLAADKAALPYVHRPPAARTELSIDDKSIGASAAHTWLAELRAGRMTIDELNAMSSSFDSAVH